MTESKVSTETREQMRQKYLKMAKSLGVDQAVSRLHMDVNKLETGTFDGGFDKDRFATVQFMREIARELYNIKLVEDSKEYYTQK